jgi:hypothetical protein
MQKPIGPQCCIIEAAERYGTGSQPTLGAGRFNITKRTYLTSEPVLKKELIRIPFSYGHVENYKA